MPAPPPARLLPLTPAGLPTSCDALLPTAADDLQGSRVWLDTLLAHAVPPGSEALLADLGAAQLPLLRQDGRLRGLATPYTLLWQPLVADGATPEALRQAGRSLAGLLRRRPPLLLEATEPTAGSLAPLLGGLRGSGLAVLQFEHFGNWHEALPPGTGWADYLAARPPALRNTIARKLARSGRQTRFERLDQPGAALEAGIEAYCQVRALSWKPVEPAPDFDPMLMRALAARGLLRLGVLRDAEGGPLAAQYWVLDRGGQRATVLKLSHIEAAKAASPGTVLTALMLQSLLEHDRVQELDFGRGDDAYKRLWVAQRRQRMGLLVADPLHPAGAGAILRHLAGKARRALRSARRPVGEVA